VSASVGSVLGATPSPTTSSTATATFPPGHAKVLNDDTVSPGWLGLVVFLSLAVATFILLRSFRRHLAKVPPTFDPPAEGPGAGPQPGPAPN
jgi:hypothetical protein